MGNLIDYETASSQEKLLLDLYSSINCHGEEGGGVPGDMVCEWGVRAVKGLTQRFSANCEFTLAQRTIRTSNVTEMKIKPQKKQNYLHN